MTTAIRAVPFPLKPWKKERLAHFLARVTTHNGYLAVSWLLEAAGLLTPGQSFNTALRRALHEPEAAKPLGLLLGISVSQVQGMRLVKVDIGSTAGLMRLDQHLVGNDTCAPLRRRYCPVCVEHHHHDTRLLDVVYYLACHIHDCRIIDTCCCGATLGWNTGLHPCCASCGAIQFGTSEAAHPALVSLAKHLAELYDGVPPPDGSPYQDLPSLLSLLQEFSGPINPGSALGRFEYGADRLDYDTLSEHACFSWRWLQNKRRFTDELNSWIEYRRWLTPDLPCRGWFVDIRRVVERITDKNCREVMKQWLEDATSAIADVCSPSKATPPPDDAEVTIRSTAWILGTSEHNVRRLFSSNRLPSTFAFKARKRSDRLVKLSDLNRLCSSVRIVATHERRDDWVRFGDAVHTFDKEGHGRGVEAVISGIVNGKLAASWIPGTGFEGLYVTSACTTPLTDEKRDGAMLSIAQSALELGIYQDALYRLIKAKVLVTSSWEVRGHERRCLSREKLQSFRDTYVFAGDLARTWGVGCTSLTDRLIDQGVDPVSGPRIDGGLVYLFRRREVERIDPATVQKNIPYKSRAGRRATGQPTKALLTSRVVCARLAITPQALGLLVKKGYLIEASESHFQGNRRFFETTNVDEYLLRFRDNPLLIELDEAARSLQSTRRMFLSKYVLTGLITTIDNGAGQLFVERDVLGNISRTDVDFLPLSIAAETLGVEKMRLKNLRTTGRIKTDVRRVLDRDVHYYSLQECQLALKSKRLKRTG